MANHHQETPATDQVDHAVGEQIRPHDSGDQCQIETALAEGSSDNSGTDGSTGSLSGQPDSGEVDQTPTGTEEGHSDNSEADLSQPEPETSPLGEALRAALASAVNNAAGNTANFEDIFWDGKNFFLQSATGWSVESVAMINSLLKCRGFSDSKGKGASFSPLDKAKVTILKERRIDKAAPRLYHPADIYTENGERILNTSRIKLMPAYPTAGAWGEFFPRYAAIFDNVFREPIYLTTFLAWFKRFYESAEEGELVLGQALAIVGPVQCFKSFIIEKVVTPAMGGSADLSDMASGQNGGFTADVFYAPLAVIDDSKGSASEASRTAYTAVIKKLAATGSQTFHEKYMNKVKVEWKGRVIIGLNEDAKSIRLLPDLDQSNDDKMIILHLQTWKDQPGPTAYKSVVTDELPHLLAWLKSWEIPEEVCDPLNRYGIKSLIAPTIKSMIYEESAIADFRSTLEEWWKGLTDKERRSPWKGTVAKLRLDLNEGLKDTGILQGMTTNALGRLLKTMSHDKDSGITIVPRSPNTRVSNRFTIFLKDVEGNSDGEVTANHSEQAVSVQ